MTNAHCRLSKNKNKCVMQELLDADIHTFDDKLKISLFNKISYSCEHLNFQFFYLPRNKLSSKGNTSVTSNINWCIFCYCLVVCY